MFALSITIYDIFTYELPNSSLTLKVIIKGVDDFAENWRTLSTSVCTQLSDFRSSRLCRRQYVHNLVILGPAVCVDVSMYTT